ncbi:hypothetical protein FSPOR_10584 [Fusarium sporotrichioides]|uniref:Uncharacterized protein n=1 Tax=Fusarium sporotrichioides TaxID=5514 RepID=A0A395RKI8_FUSSP|nr:hypothetical protein FSPOR_10584 [Fusarium sporotrichioides]
MSHTVAVKQAPVVNFDHTDDERRRLYIKAFFGFHCQWDEDIWQSLRDKAESDVYSILHANGFRRAGKAHVEYAVDAIAYGDYAIEFGLNQSVHPWPWGVQMEPGVKDYSDGPSETYETWRRMRGLPTPRPRPNDGA